MYALSGATILWGPVLEPRQGAALLVNEEAIVDLVPPAAVPSDAQLVDCAGLHLIPGLLDCHVHLAGWRSANRAVHLFDSEALRAARATIDAQRLLQAGFTTVRDCGGPIAIEIGAAIREGSVAGPDVLAAGKFVERTAGADDITALPLEWARDHSPQGTVLADGPWAVRRAVREQVRAGADWIKTCSTGATGNPASDAMALEWTDEELGALIDEAHRLGRRVAVHAHAASGILQAVRAGADTIEHGTFLDAAAAEAMAAASVPLVPTLSGRRLLTSRGAEYGVPDWKIRRAQEGLASQAEAVGRALQAGVPIAMGSDTEGEAIQPHGANAYEVTSMVEAGMSPADALRSTTIVAAQALHIDDRVGSLEQGKRADIVGVRGDPRTDIGVLGQVDLVFKRGLQVRGAAAPHGAA